MNSIFRFAIAAALVTALACNKQSEPKYRAFATPEDAVKALTSAAKAKQLNDVVAIFGPDGQDLIDSSDPVQAQRNRDVFLAAVAERLHDVARHVEEM